MKNMTPRRMAKACGGVYEGREEDLDLEISFLTTDSRKAGPGCLFAAILGERVDGHQFIPEVFAKGALVILSEKKLPEGEGNYILVPSTTAALSKLAAYYLEQLRIPVVGITGSVGKTSTKEMVAAVLSRKYRTLKTSGNFNNELGLPLTIFRLRDEDEIAVLEMGINHFGEMHRLAEIAKPDSCLITNIGQCHLEFLGDRDGVLRAKSEIFDFLRPDGHIILNGDDDKLQTIGEVKGIRPVFFGLDASNAVYADRIKPRGLEGIGCRICVGEDLGNARRGDCVEVEIPIPGVHMVRNALAGTAVGLQYGLTLDEIRAGIESLEPVNGRFRIMHTDKFTVIDDCYNANPMSVRASLELLQEASGRRIAILGDMKELGEEEEAIHRELGEYAGGLDLELVITVGPLAAHIAEGIRKKNAKIKTLSYEDLDSLFLRLPSLLCEGDTILVKASHSMKFDKIVAELEKL